MKILRKPTGGLGRILVLTLALVGWQLTCSPALAELANDQAVFIDITGTECGIVSAETMEVVNTFPCDRYSEGIDITSDGTRAVIGNCAYNTLTLMDLMSDPPAILDQIDSGVRCVQELDIAPDDSFAIATGSANGLVSKFTLEPFEVTGTSGPWDPDAVLYGGSPQDVHINSSGTRAIQPTYWSDIFALLDVTQDAPVLMDPIPTPDNPVNPGSALSHHGISLSQYDDDTFVATGTPWLMYITIGSLSNFFDPVVLETPGRPESVDITCDGTRAVVETSAGLMWIDLEATPPVVLSDNFGPTRIDYNSTSTVAFSADGSLLFVGGNQQIDVYDVNPDLPVLRGSIPMQGRIYSVATLPCSAASTELEVAVDIEPRSCPNQLYVKSRGVVKVAILGSEDFDVMSVDPRSVQIDGVSPFNWKLKDAATPYDTDSMQGDCRDCTRKGRDGFLDLVLMFKRKDIAKVIGPATDESCLVLTLTGQTFEGKDILGDDVVHITSKKQASKNWFKSFFFTWLKAHKNEKADKDSEIEKPKKIKIKKKGKKKKSAHKRAKKHWDH